MFNSFLTRKVLLPGSLPPLSFGNLLYDMAGGKHTKLTKEEELLLQDFSRNVTTKSSALFYGNSFIVSVVPLCKK